MNNAKELQPLPPLDTLKEFLNYNPVTGQFTWLKRPYRANTIKPGDLAGGSSGGHGYTLISFGGFKYQAHRLAWFMYYGTDPVNHVVDHKNRCRDDNRIDNLRLATISQNSGNCAATGYHKTKDGKFQACVIHKRKRHYLGTFNCPLLARMAYEAKKKELCGEFTSF